MTLSTKEVPYSGPYSVSGEGKHKGPTAEALKRAMKRAGFGFANKELGDLNQTYNSDLEAALDRWNPGGQNGYAKGRYDKIRALKCGPEEPHAGEYALDEYARRLIRDEMTKAAVPNLGVVFAGGKTVLKHDLTHATSGLPCNPQGVSLWPAFDDAFNDGITIIAPEDLEVYQASSSNPGDACYCKGKSKIRYWFGHLTTAPAVGVKIKKGQKVGVTCVNNIGGGPHVHVAVNVELLWGTNKYLSHKTSYSHGAPLIGDQLAAGRAL